MTTTPQPPTATEVTPAALAELERLALAAPERPYRVDRERGENVIMTSVSFMVLDRDGGVICESCTEDEARFIAAACNAALPLVAQLRADQAAREAAEAELDAAGISAEIANSAQRFTVDERILLLHGQREVESEAADIALRNFEQAAEERDTMERERDELRQRSERVEADAAELRARLHAIHERVNLCVLCDLSYGEHALVGLKRLCADGQPFTDCDMQQADEARALLARTGAERRDGVTHCNTCGEDVGAYTVRGVPVCACNVSDEQDGGE